MLNILAFNSPQQVPPEAVSETATTRSAFGAQLQTALSNTDDEAPTQERVPPTTPESPDTQPEDATDTSNTDRNSTEVSTTSHSHLSRISRSVSKQTEDNDLQFARESDDANDEPCSASGTIVVVPIAATSELIVLPNETQEIRGPVAPHASVASSCSPEAKKPFETDGISSNIVPLLVGKHDGTPTPAIEPCLLDTASTEQSDLVFNSFKAAGQALDTRESAMAENENSSTAGTEIPPEQSQTTPPVLRLAELDPAADARDQSAIDPNDRPPANSELASKAQAHDMVVPLPQATTNNADGNTFKVRPTAKSLDTSDSGTEITSSVRIGGAAIAEFNGSVAQVKSQVGDPAVASVGHISGEDSPTKIQSHSAIASITDNHVDRQTTIAVVDEDLSTLKPAEVERKTNVEGHLVLHDSPTSPPHPNNGASEPPATNTGNGEGIASFGAESSQQTASSPGVTDALLVRDSKSTEMRVQYRSDELGELQIIAKNDGAHTETVIRVARAETHYLMAAEAERMQRDAPENRIQVQFENAGINFDMNHDSQRQRKHRSESHASSYANTSTWTPVDRTSEIMRTTWPPSISSGSLDLLA